MQLCRKEKMMDDLIKRQDAINAIVKQTIYTADIIKSRCKARLVDANGWLGGLKDAIEAVEDVPQKTGKWIKKIIPSTLGYYECECSECGHIWQYREVLNWNYCPNCGAKMGVDEE